jgi:hypothetical protein
MQTWKVESLSIPGTPECTSCHRMGLGSAFGEYGLNTGTSQEFGAIATDQTLQPKKDPWDPAHPNDAPFWLGYMYAGANGGDAGANTAALVYQHCAEDWAYNGTTPGCTVTQYGGGVGCTPAADAGGTGGGH